MLRYRIHLEGRRLAPGTANLGLGAVRRLAYEAADCGLLSPDLAAGIRRVKGVKKISVRLGNWLTAEQSQRLWQAPGGLRLKEKRDRALLAVLLACGLRRHEGGACTALAAKTPLGRLGRVTDIAPLAVFLASDESAWITGEVIRAGGGLIVGDLSAIFPLCSWISGSNPPPCNWEASKCSKPRRELAGSLPMGPYEVREYPFGDETV